MSIYLIPAFLLCIAIALVYTVHKIRMARERGQNLPKKNTYYAWVAKLFIKDLPD